MAQQWEDILDKGDVYTGYRLYSTGLELNRMSFSLYDHVMFVKGANMKMFLTLDFYNLFQYLNRLGRIYLWISLSSFPYLMVLALFWWW